MENRLHSPIDDYIDKNMAVEDGDRVVSEGVQKMEQLQADSLVILQKGRPHGIVTYRDVLFDVVSKGKDPSKIALREIARTPLYTIKRGSRIIDAISLMRRNNVRRLIVTDGDLAIGLVSQKTLAGNLSKHSIALPELEMPDKIKCPYCPSIFDDKTKLSSHIDDIHVGRGVFEGNVSRQNDLGSISSASDYPKTL